MAQLQDISAFANQLLEIHRFRDYCPNGLQVEGRDDVARIVSGVTASQALIDAAIEQRADVILVHHGYFWKGENAAITGMKKARVEKLIKHDLSLLAYHLPLDSHDVVGNNATLAKQLDIQVQGRLTERGDFDLVFLGEFKSPIDSNDISALVESRLERKPLHIAPDNRQVKRVAWCTGGAQNYFDAVARENIDLYITGEVSEQNYHTAMEANVHFLAAGHHATERYGVQALGELLARQFDLEHTYVEIDNPV